MADHAKPVVLEVTGMTCQGCVNAVTRIVRKADPHAEVDVDLANGRVNALTTVDPHSLADAVSKGGYDAVPLA
jgi:copper chaperone